MGAGTARRACGLALDLWHLKRRRRPQRHKELVLSAGYDDTVKTLIYSGRPLHVRRTPYVSEWKVFPVQSGCMALLSSSIGKTSAAKKLSTSLRRAASHTTSSWKSAQRYL